MCDTDRTVGEAYEAKKAADEQYPDFPRRLTYLVDPQGLIARAYAVTDVRAHPDEVLADLTALASR